MAGRISGFLCLITTIGHRSLPIYKTGSQWVSLACMKRAVYTLNYATGTKGDIIVTSRQRDIKRLGEVLELPPLTNAESIELLLHNYREPRAEKLRVVATKIVARLGYLALAIDLAAAYLDHQRASPDAVSNFITATRLRRRGSSVIRQSFFGNMAQGNAMALPRRMKL